MICRQSYNSHVTGDHWMTIRKLSNVRFDGLYQSPDQLGVSPTLKRKIEERNYKVYFSSAQTLSVPNVKKRSPYETHEGI